MQGLVARMKQHHEKCSFSGGSCVEDDERNMSEHAGSSGLSMKGLEKHHQLDNSCLDASFKSHFYQAVADNTQYYSVRTGNVHFTHFKFPLLLMAAERFGQLQLQPESVHQWLKSREQKRPMLKATCQLRGWNAHSQLQSRHTRRVNSESVLIFYEREREREREIQMPMKVEAQLTYVIVTNGALAAPDTTPPYRETKGAGTEVHAFYVA
ncbi:hypothetical protein UY3_10035 [Chelonia mydas]|uniref:Uncharacterized protein n=1 Tax=Chelonia mydas TaxID=8469 RepID=M7BBA1_CHEMY|nr:hypothetical protein UY3_10035 [Chelonia mydas]